MMNNQALVLLLESILGKGRITNKGNMSFFCPFPNCPSIQKNKQKLEIQLNTNDKKENPWHCWSCDNKGKSIRSLLNSINFNNKQQKLEELKLCLNITYPNQYTNINLLKLPDEFISLNDQENLKKLDKIQKIFLHKAICFLRNRNLNQFDFIRYNIGVCLEGKYKNRIIIPSYNSKGELNYFIARDFTNMSYSKYLNPSVDVKNIIGMELFINWDAPIILVEGIFDYLTVKRNCIPLFGKVIHDNLIKKIIKSKTNDIYIALDRDALKFAIKQSEKLSHYGKNIYLVEIENGNDPNEIGFNNFLKYLKKAKLINFQTLIEYKLNTI